MNCLVSRNTDPFFNLALEEHILINEKDDFFLLWQSIPAVIVGKHQNALAELNYRFVHKNVIHIARRLSGGGTVFHDPGNLNFTFIVNGEPGKLVDFGRFIMPVIQFLETLGINALPGLKNEILVNGKKVSGNAEHIYKNRVLHHGTLLFNADLNLLREATKVENGKYTDRAVQSNRSIVANLAGFLPYSPDMDEFSRLFMQFIIKRFQGKVFILPKTIMEAVHALARSKYQSWEWIYGWSPDYEFRGSASFPAGILGIFLQVHRGNIVNCAFEPGQFPADSLGSLHGRLTGSRHEMDNLIRHFMESGITGCNDKKCLEEALYDFF